MSTVLLAGLTDTEAAAIEIMVGMTWRDHQCVTLARGVTLGVPEQGVPARACRSCVVGLFGMGMRKHSASHERQLLEFLQGRSAVLLVWGTGGGWLEARVPLERGQHVTWLSVPYSSAGLRDALKRVMAATRAAPPPADPPHTTGDARFDRARGDSDWRDSVPEEGAAARLAPSVLQGHAPAVPAWRRALSLADRLQSDRNATADRVRAVARTAAHSRPAPLHVERVTSHARHIVAARNAASPSPESDVHGQVEALAPAISRLPDQAVGLKRGALGILLDVMPDLRQVAFMRFVVDASSGDGVKLLGIGESGFVMDTQGGWLAAGLPVSALLRMLHTPGLLESVRIAPLPSELVEETVRGHLGGKFHRAQKPLDVITWELTSAALRDVRLEAKADLSFQLRRFPNFPQIEQVGALDVQLAAICARMPQSIHELQRAFPRREQEVLRFAVLCITSGLAAVIPGASGPARALPIRADAAVRRGFFKSLLDKLF